MLSRLRAILPIIFLLALAGTAGAANEELVMRLKELGSAVDNMSAHISSAESDADAQLLASVIKKTFENGLKDDKPDITIEARQGYCRATISTPGWRLWSEAQSGKIVDHGAKIH